MAGRCDLAQRVQASGAWTCRGEICGWDSYPEYLDGDFCVLKDIYHGAGLKEPGIAWDLLRRIREFSPSPTLFQLTEVYKFWIAYADIDGFRVDTVSGQKTGFYLDQREARDRVEALAAGRSVLDLFGYTGGFALADSGTNANAAWATGRGRDGRSRLCHRGGFAPGDCRPLASCPPATQDQALGHQWPRGPRG